MIALHAPGEFPVHPAGGPSSERAFLEHVPGGVVHSHACFDRTTLRGAVANCVGQRIVHETDCQDGYGTDRNKSEARAAQTRNAQAESHSDSRKCERDPYGAGHGCQHGQRQGQPQQKHERPALLGQRNGKDPQDVQRHSVRDCLQEWAAGAVGMDAQALVENESREDQGPDIHQKSDGCEDQVRQRQDDEDFEVPARGRPAKNQNCDVEQNQGNKEFAGDQAPCLRVEGVAEGAEYGESNQAQHGQGESSDEGNLLAQGKRSQRYEEREYAQGNPIGVIEVEVRRPKKKGCHGCQVEDRGEREPQLERLQQQTEGRPSPIGGCEFPGRRAAAHRVNQAPSGANSTRIVDTRMRRSRARVQFSM